VVFKGMVELVGVTSGNSSPAEHRADQLSDVEFGVSSAISCSTSIQVATHNDSPDWKEKGYLDVQYVLQGTYSVSSKYQHEQIHHNRSTITISLT
jgi:hypothetical protein